MRKWIAIYACDGTSIIEIDTNENQAHLIRDIAELFNAKKTTCCVPGMTISDVPLEATDGGVKIKS